MIISSNNTPDLAPQRFQATLRKKSIPSSMYQHKPDGTKSLWSHMQSTTAHKVTPLGTPAAPWLPARPKGDPAVHHPRSTVARRAAFWGQSHMPINACNMQTLKQAYAQAYSFHWQEVPNTENALSSTASTLQLMMFGPPVQPRSVSVQAIRQPRKAANTAHSRV